jgi:hypothetical protein
MYKKILNTLWGIREIYMPFIIGISLSIFTLFFIGISIKFSIYIIEDFTIQLLFLHPAKNRKII